MLNGGLQFTQLGEFKLSKSYVLLIIKNNAFNNVYRKKDSKIKENRFHFKTSFQMRIKITLWP